MKRWPTALRSGLMKYVPKPLEGNVNVSRTHPLKELLLLCGGVLGLVLAAYLALGFAVDWIVPYVPQELEEKIAAKIPMPPTKHKRHAEYLQQLAESLAENAPNDAGSVTLGVMEMGEENAFALPGGRIYFTRRLLENVGSENELAMILAHEMGHCANRDHLRSIGRGLTMALLASFLINSDDAVEYFIGPSITLGHLSHSRKREELADRHGLETLVATYGHGGGATEFFSRINDNEEYKHPPKYLSSHPAPHKRVSYLEESLAEIYGAEEGELTPLPDWWDEWEEKSP